MVLRSLGCNFKGKGYENEALKNIKVYLTNVNAEYPLFPNEAYMSRRLVNRGGLDMRDLSLFKEQESIMQKLEYDISNASVNTDIRLRCYPNEAEEEAVGTAFTRLVVEGEIAGEIYYWPVNINRTDGGRGISRNCRYIYDIIITGLGNKDPDIPIETGFAEINMKVDPWEEKEDYGLHF